MTFTPDRDMHSSQHSQHLKTNELTPSCVEEEIKGDCCHFAVARMNQG